MAYVFKLTAKRNVCFKNSGDVAMAKGMTFEHIEQACSTPNAPNVSKALTQKFGREVYIPTVTLYFDITKL